MIIKYKDMRIEVEELIIIAFFSFLFSKNIRLYLSNYFICLLFTTFHELSHITVGAIFGVIPNKVRIRLAGLNAEYKVLKDGKQNIVIYLAGPLSNLLLAVIFQDVKIVYEVNLALCLINLVPIKPLDGYNILKTFLNSKKLTLITNCTFCILIMLAFYSIYEYKNASILVLLIYIKIINIISNTTTKCDI